MVSSYFKRTIRKEIKQVFREFVSDAKNNPSISIQTLVTDTGFYVVVSFTKETWQYEVSDLYRLGEGIMYKFKSNSSGHFTAHSTPIGFIVQYDSIINWDKNPNVKRYSVRNSLGGEVGYVETDGEPIVEYSNKSGLTIGHIKNLNFTFVII